MSKPGEGCIAKKDLRDRSWYVNKNFGRGMRLGMWDAGQEKFICIKGPKFGTYSVYTMPHFQDDEGNAIFEPIRNVTREMNLDVPPV